MVAQCESILIIEDDEAIRTSLNDILTAEGYTVFEAANGKVALNLLAKLPQPALILLDLMMPVMNGYDFSDAVQKMQDKTQFPIVVMSASRDGEQYARTNSFPFLKKPLDVENLLQLVNTHCRLKK